MDTQTALGNFGSPFEFIWEGKIYTLKYRVQKVKASFEKLVKQRAINIRMENKNLLPEDEFQRQLDILYEKFDDGFYSYDSEFCTQFIQTIEGQCILIKLLLGDEGEKLSEENLIKLLQDKGDIIKAYMRSQESNLKTIYMDLGWNPDIDPTMQKFFEEIDPKKVQSAIQKAGITLIEL